MKHIANFDANRTTVKKNGVGIRTELYFSGGLLGDEFLELIFPPYIRLFSFVNF